ncbi:hypothetical protein GLOTRDRAFT_49718 [Gloeophyllum trabeum ATCC 11539]|uniref:HAT C-terminal dimerisation domain-containing protein n=1 Tax=Gloeophyllum trabeum (strain ATCC 11539 / FP-39264 / Madison 617) TaxID=670483 RepID=S7PTF0_GLOTA|nr:uncharacterized protein GLOTRDRAFT_49718 [Gloeophyllum trabeum ATCC 11539]EPQ51031.1 hypothetical protein GLOTRDRAFT_49718 [Gloeophyllum trabeum ATCC 11539]
MSRPSSSTRNRAWYRQLFYDHPKLPEKAPEAYVGKDKAKVWCKLCFDQLVLLEVARDQAEVARGKKAAIRPRSEIERALWDLPHGAGWLAARSSSLLPHLRDCHLQPQVISDRARNEHQRALSPRHRHPGLDPDHTIPPQYVLTKRILPKEVQVFHDQAIAICHGCEVTVECDGWSGINHHHFVAFMIAVNGKVWGCRRAFSGRWPLDDTTNQVKNADNLLLMLREVIQTAERDWGVTVVAVTSDCSGESRSARKKLLLERPQLVTPDCYAHQINLVVGDYFKSSEWFFTYADMANEALTIIRAVLTRWTAHYLAYRRLLEVKTSLELLAEHPQLYASGDAVSRAKTEKMIPIIKNSLFWHHLARIKNHLEPLAIAAHITQAAHCRLDQVLLTFGLFVMQYSSMTDPADKTVVEVIVSSLERRWEKADQDVFIAAVILNPFYKTKPFQRIAIFNNARIYMLMSRLWTRFFSCNTPSTLNTELMEYMEDRNTYDGLAEYSSQIAAGAYLKGESPDPLNVWKGFSYAGSEPSPLVKLANHILSICANSASCERLFSTFGLILTKLRNRLGEKTMLSLAELKMHLRDEHVRNDVQQRLKRHLGGARPPPQAMDPGHPPSQDASGSGSEPIPPSAPRPAFSTPTDDPAGATTSQSLEGAERHNTIRNIAATLEQMIEEDTEDTETPYPSKISLKLTEIFDFSTQYWTAEYAEKPRRSLDDELELYQLLDLDAEGEEVEADFTLDDAAGAVLAM